MFRLFASDHLNPPLRGSAQDGSTDVGYETGEEESVDDLGSDVVLSKGPGEKGSLHTRQEGTLSATKSEGFRQ